ncbi:MAG: hypothetical protein EHM23_12025 [Acidobacteria bacterium]|nr:MAG: hypothetical protein EHM23_12025 [Acidobacteriota bacterium]
MLKDTGSDLRFTFEPTDRGGDLSLDVVSSPAEAAGVMDPRLLSSSATSFLHHLQSELARANRYNFFVSLLLLTILPTPESKYLTEQERLAELACLLDQSLRTTDILGSVGNGLVGVIAPHSDLDTAARLLQRLQAQSLFSVFRKRTGCELRAAFSVYPTDATTPTCLFDIALARLLSEGDDQTGVSIA